jgi:hypothetical protein
VTGAETRDEHETAGALARPVSTGVSFPGADVTEGCAKHSPGRLVNDGSRAIRDDANNKVYVNTDRRRPHTDTVLESARTQTGQRPSVIILRVTRRSTAAASTFTRP